MANNTAQIAKIKALLAAGVTSHTTESTSTTVDLAALRTELLQLLAEDDATIAAKRTKKLFRPVNVADFVE